MRGSGPGATIRFEWLPSKGGPWVAVAAGLLVVFSLALPWAGERNGVDYRLGALGSLLSAFAAVVVFVGAAVGRGTQFGMGAIVIAWASAGLLTFQMVDIHLSIWEIDSGPFFALFAAVVIALTATYVGSPTAQRILGTARHH